MSLLWVSRSVGTLPIKPIVVRIYFPSSAEFCFVTHAARSWGLDFRNLLCAHLLAVHTASNTSSSLLSHCPRAYARSDQKTCVTPCAPEQHAGAWTLPGLCSTFVTTCRNYPVQSAIEYRCAKRGEGACRCSPRLVFVSFSQRYETAVARADRAPRVAAVARSAAFYEHQGKGRKNRHWHSWPLVDLCDSPGRLRLQQGTSDAIDRAHGLILK